MQVHALSLDVVRHSNLLYLVESRLPLVNIHQKVTVPYRAVLLWIVLNFSVSELRTFLGMVSLLF